jgi:hypothetical protein
MSEGPVLGVWHRTEGTAYSTSDVADTLGTELRSDRVRRHRVPAAVVGAVAALAGSALATCWYVLHDIVVGAPLRTPSLLAAALIEGRADAPVPPVTILRLFEYAATHIAILLLLGWTALALLAAERWPRIRLALLFLFSCFAMSVPAAILIQAEWLLDLVEPATILGGNLLDVAGVLIVFAWSGRLVASRRVLRHRVRRRAYRSW